MSQSSNGLARAVARPMPPDQEKPATVPLVSDKRVAAARLAGQKLAEGSQAVVFERPNCHDERSISGISAQTPRVPPADETTPRSLTSGVSSGSHADQQADRGCPA